MTNQRFIVDKSGDFQDNQTGYTIIDFGYNFNGMECREILNLMNGLNNENERIKQTIKEAYQTERTQIGKNVLKQLLDQLE